MVTLIASGVYQATPSDSLIRVKNNAVVTVILPPQGSPNQTITLQDASNGAQITVLGPGINPTLVTNFQKLSVSWDNAAGAWFI